MKISIESASVHEYINNIHAIINRMASNSASAKTWCIALVSATITFASDKDKPNAVWMALVPITLFFLIDSYYLGLERRYRDMYNNFVGKLQADSATIKDLFVLAPTTKEKLLVSIAKAASSISIWPFYVLIVVMLTILRNWLF